MSGGAQLLLIDIGNTRVKWAWQSSAQSEMQNHGALPNAAGLAELPFLSQEIDMVGVLASNVAGREREDEIVGLIRKRMNAEVVFARPQQEICGVTTAYAKPSSLGTDRWSALLAAHALGPNAYCIVDAGSTITMDFLLPDGQHLGGYIAPGHDMSLKAMAQGTAQLASRLKEYSGAARDIAPGTNSAQAIGKGVLAAQIGLIRLGMDMLEEAVGSAPRLLLTGGGSEALLATKALPQAELIPDLVLRGLTALALELRLWPE